MFLIARIGAEWRQNRASLRWGLAQFFQGISVIWRICVSAAQDVYESAERTNATVLDVEEMSAAFEGREGLSIRACHPSLGADPQ